MPKRLTMLSIPYFMHDLLADGSHNDSDDHDDKDDKDDDHNYVEEDMTTLKMKWRRRRKMMILLKRLMIFCLAQRKCGNLHQHQGFTRERKKNCAKHRWLV